MARKHRPLAHPIVITGLVIVGAVVVAWAGLSGGWLKTQVIPDSPLDPEAIYQIGTRHTSLQAVADGGYTVRQAEGVENGWLITTLLPGETGSTWRGVMNNDKFPFPAGLTIRQHNRRVLQEYRVTVVRGPECEDENPQLQSFALYDDGTFEYKPRAKNYHFRDSFKYRLSRKDGATNAPNVPSEAEVFIFTSAALTPRVATPVKNAQHPYNPCPN